MMQERIDGEKLHALQQVQRSMDPFQEGSGGERLRAFGLSNMYMLMADPSHEFVKATINRLAGLPFSNLQQLLSDTYSAGYYGKEFFARYGVEVKDWEILREGASHTGELLDHLMMKFDSETGELRWGETLNVEKMAEAAYERIKISKDERRVRIAVEQVRNEPDLKRRHRLGLNLKRQFLNHIRSFGYTFSRRFDHEHSFEPTWQNLISNDFSTELETKEGTILGNFEFQEAVDTAQAAILRYPFERRIEKISSKDQEHFDQLRFQYGAKAANLIILSELVGSINRLRRGAFSLELAIPDFQTVPVDSYRAWREGKLIDDQLRPYFEWASGLKDEGRWYAEDQHPADYMVRSSAVFSEDGENVTGAGIYESVKVQGGVTFEEFKEAVTKVYESTNSPQAQAYRAEHAIGGVEEMGLVIQRFVSPDSFRIDSKGYLNSKLPGVPGLMEIVTERSRNFIKRGELDFFLAMNYFLNENALAGVHHFAPDINRVNPKLPIKVAQLAYVVERIWGREIQVEFVTEGSTVNFLQVRELPANATGQSPEIQFPDETPMYSGASIGVGDMELPVLDNKDDNSEKNGVVMFVGNYGFSFQHRDWQLPKEGAVIVWNDDGQNGHIQTLCAEKGLVCIFPDKNRDERDVRYRDLSELKKIRVVSNGIEARVYQS